MSDQTIIKKIVREVVKEEFVPVEKRIYAEMDRKFNLFQTAIIESVKGLLQDFRNDFVTMKDEIVGELQAMREEQTFLNHRSMKINQIEDDVENLKVIHPENKHFPAPTG